jgi:hypothetical protein
VKRYLMIFKVTSVAPIYYDKERRIECKFQSTDVKVEINVLVTMGDVNSTGNDIYVTRAVQKHNDSITKVSLSESHTHLPMSTPTNYVPFREGKWNY